MPEILKKIDGSIEIIDATPEWKREYHSLFSGNMGRLEDLEYVNFIIKIFDPEVAKNWIPNEGRDLLTSIRLASNCRVGTPIVISDSTSPKPRGLFYTAQPSDEFTVQWAHIKDELSDEAAHRALEIFRYLRTLRRDKKLDSISFALRRYNQSFGRKLPEDAIVDLVVALESLITNRETSEVSYKFRARGTAILCDASSPKVQWKLLDGAYGLRSKIVHGDLGGKEFDQNLRKLDAANLSTAQDTIRELAGRVLVAILQQLPNFKSFAQFHEDLGERIKERLGRELQ